MITIISINIIIIIISIIGIYFYNKKYLKQYKNKYYEQIKTDLTFKAEQAISNLTTQISSLNNEIKLKQEFNENLYKIREEELNKFIDKAKEIKVNELQHQIEDWSKSAQEAAEINAKLQQNEIQKSIDSARSTLTSLTTEINDYKSKRDSINKEILRARAIEEQQDFYRVQLDDNSLYDIKILLNIKKELRKIDLLDKLIYDNYISKPVNEMIKRVLNGDTYSGIYKITRLKTGEVYIGRTVDIKARWQGHAKTAFHCGSISHSMLHTLIEKDGIENFTWEVIEQVPKDQLNEREKYWIDFYGSKKFGMNEKEGG